MNFLVFLLFIGIAVSVEAQVGIKSDRQALNIECIRKGADTGLCFMQSCGCYSIAPQVTDNQPQSMNAAWAICQESAPKCHEMCVNGKQATLGNCDCDGICRCYTSFP